MSPKQFIAKNKKKNSKNKIKSIKTENEKENKIIMVRACNPIRTPEWCELVHFFN